MRAVAVRVGTNAVSCDANVGGFVLEPIGTGRRTQSIAAHSPSPGLNVTRQYARMFAAGVTGAGVNTALPAQQLGLSSWLHLWGNDAFCFAPTFRRAGQARSTRCSTERAAATPRYWASSKIDTPLRSA